MEIHIYVIVKIFTRLGQLLLIPTGFFEGKLLVDMEVQTRTQC